jgi:hypothetical protein
LINIYLTTQQYIPEDLNFILAAVRTWNLTYYNLLLPFIACAVCREQECGSEKITGFIFGSLLTSSRYHCNPFEALIKHITASLLLINNS